MTKTDDEQEVNMAKNKTLEELGSYRDRLETLTLSGASKHSICSQLNITISDFHKWCRSLASDDALKRLGV